MPTFYALCIRMNIRSFVLLIFIALATPLTSYASCDFMLSNEDLMDKLSNAPETGMDFQMVELEMTDGTFISDVIIQGSRYLQYKGERSFTEVDIKDLSRVFDRVGNQIYP